MSHPPVKVDLHLHSHASNVTGYYSADRLSIPESYSEPKVLYRMLKQRGMSLVTLTDHNAIDGVKELLDAGYDDVFISSEITTTFPEDGCNIHVTVANVTEAQFAEVLRLRKNVYEMIAYLDTEIANERDDRLIYFMTHPLMSTQNRAYGRDGSLSVSHLQKMMLLCNTFEIHNGARTRALNDLTARMLGTLNPQTIERFANQYDIAPKGPTPWLKGITAGSDDHAGINPGRTWTEFDGTAGVRPTANHLVDALRNRRTRAVGEHGGPVTLAHAIFKLLHDGGRRRNGPAASRPPVLGGSTDTLLRLVFSADGVPWHQRASLRARWAWRSFHESVRPPTGSQPFEKVLDREVARLLTDTGFRAELASLDKTDERIFLVLGTLVNRIFKVYLHSLQKSGGRDIVGAVKDLVALVASNLFVSLPYFASFLAQSSDSLITRDVRKAFHIESLNRLVLITDTLFEVNGVTGTIRRMIDEAIARGVDLTVVTCVDANDLPKHLADPKIRALVDAGRLKLMPSITSFDFPEYDGLKVHFPPFLELLRFLQEGGFTKMQISTPGTMGLAGLAAAKLLQIETSSTYHTSIPEYVENYTRDITMEAAAWKFVVLFYHSVDEVVVPSKYIARLLHKRGLRNRKLLVLDRWVDTERFTPARREAGYWQRRGAPEGAVVFVYLGRLGVEKNLHLVAAAYRRLRAQREDVHLALVGDGPYRAELEALLEGLPVTFTGFVQGAELATAIASADVKLFPSTTDTWGNAPLEAQACGLPVVVSNVGGPFELMEEGVTGFAVAGRDPDNLHDAMVALLDTDLRSKMGEAARAFTVKNRVPHPYTAILDADGYRASVREAQHPNRAVIVLPQVSDRHDNADDVEGVVA